MIEEGPFFKTLSSFIYIVHLQCPISKMLILGFLNSLSTDWEENQRTKNLDPSVHAIALIDNDVHLAQQCTQKPLSHFKI